MHELKKNPQLLSFNDFQVMTEQLIDELGLREDSVFLKLGSSGLISFSDYIFLLTLLSSKLLKCTRMVYTTNLV
jgi:hypothetical protein